MSNPVKVSIVFTRPSKDVAWLDQPFHLESVVDPRYQLTREESQDGLTLTITRTYPTFEDYSSWNFDPTVNDSNNISEWITYNFNNNITHTRTISYTG
jgi:hypothetical protein